MTGEKPSNSLEESLDLLIYGSAIGDGRGSTMKIKTKIYG